MGTCSNSANAVLMESESGKRLARTNREDAVFELTWGVLSSLVRYCSRDYQVASLKENR